MISAEEARARLQEGNRRFVAGIRSPETARSYTRSVELVVEQRPFATILGCSDARVPPEIVFDQGLSDLFVIRVAGSVADSTQIGSIEYAVMKLGTPLVVVLGHSRCGGVLATIEQMQRRAENLSPNLVSIIDHIRPAIEPAEFLPIAERFSRAYTTSCTGQCTCFG